MKFEYVESFVLFLLSFIFIKLLQHFAKPLGLIDIPNERSLHKKPIPRGAGIAIFLAIILVGIFTHLELIKTNIWIVVSIFLVVLVGTLDDQSYYPVSPRLKFIFIAIGTFLVSYFNGLVIDDLGIYFGYHITLGWFAIPFTLFAVIGLTNAINLIDGIDALAGTIGLIILTTFWIVGMTYEDLVMTHLSGGYIIALLTFLLFNTKPASIFMGDSGSLTLGFVISILAIRAIDYLPATTILFIVAFPVMDTFFVMARRATNKLPIMQADKLHTHHILKSLFNRNSIKVVTVLGLAQITSIILGLRLSVFYDSGIDLLIFVMLGLFFYLMYIYYIHHNTLE
ncbi:MAG: hypothetical protein RL113_1310 [Pseudomonadota bacterium]